MPQTYFHLSMIRLRSACIAAALLALLLPALLVAQWTGLQHRIAHAWIAASVSASADHDAAASDHDETPHFSHSCTLFDAVALGVTLQSAFFLPVCLRAMLAQAQPPVPPPDHLHSFRHFSPRAPPLR